MSAITKTETETETEIEDSSQESQTQSYLLADRGNHDESYFEDKMSPFRLRIRSKLVPFISGQSDTLCRWQEKFRHPFLDIFFLYTALLGSHTFYVICLPIPAWIGFFETTRDMVYILGYSIYISGFLKDYLCLPRPNSPPVERITLSESTAREYGAPSSHTANAVGITSYFLWKLYFLPDISIMNKILYGSIALFYCSSLILGRIYCGMHGLLDLFCGLIIGLFCFICTIVWKQIFCDINIGNYWWFPIVSICWGLFILFIHVRPIEECPCFDDTVAFIGVICGIECSDWFIKYFGFKLVYDFKNINMAIDLMRIVIGVLCIVIWKYLFSRTLCDFIVLKILRINDDRKDTVIELNAFEMRERALLGTKHKECLPFSGVSIATMISRFISYAGIPVSAMIISPIIISGIENVSKALSS